MRNISSLIVTKWTTTLSPRSVWTTFMTEIWRQFRQHLLEGKWMKCLSPSRDDAEKRINVRYISEPHSSYFLIAVKQSDRSTFVSSWHWTRRWVLVIFYKFDAIGGYFVIWQFHLLNRNLPDMVNYEFSVALKRTSTRLLIATSAIQPAIIALLFFFTSSNRFLFRFTFGPAFFDLFTFFHSDSNCSTIISGFFSAMSSIFCSAFRSVLHDVHLIQSVQLKFATHFLFNSW